MDNTILQGFQTGSDLVARGLGIRRANQELELQKQKLAADLDEFKQQQAIRKAAEDWKAELANIQMQGMRDFDSAVAQGVKPADAWAKFGWKIQPNDYSTFITQHEKAAPFTPKKVNIEGEDLYEVSPGHYQFPRPKPAEKLDPSEKSTKEVENLMTAIEQEQALAEQAKIAGNEEEANRHLARAEAYASKVKGAGFELETNNQGGVTLRYGSGVGKGPLGKPTVATQSQGQQKLLKYQNATELLSRLERGLSAGDVGARGVAGEYILDRGLAQFLPQFANQERIESRSALTAAREGLLREISDDNRFSNRDREEIEKALPSNGIFESLPAAQTKLRTVRDILRKRGKVYSSALGLKDPSWTMTPDEIRKAFKDGKITEAEAVEALERFN